MALPFLPVPPFPDVPPLPGVPPLAREAGELLAGTHLTRFTADLGIVESLMGISAAPQWGIFDNDVHHPVLVGDAVVAQSPSAEAHVPDYPIENGGFQSYNKVQLPKEVVLSIAKGGTIAERQAFVKAIDDLRTSLTLYSVIAPDTTLRNMNVVGARWDRTAREGAQLIVADIRLREIRLAPAPAFTNTKDAASAATQNIGPVQAQAPSASQQAVAGAVN